MNLVEVDHAVVEFGGPGGRVRALDGVSINVASGEIMAVVGESGCGKTTLARAILGLQPLASGQIRVSGKIVEGVSSDIAERIGMVWQDPYASLDPRWTMGDSASEPAELRKRSLDLSQLFEEVGLKEEFIGRYPHQLSGGQRQRVAIARALALRPPLVICDEPTAALDLSIRAQILNLIKAIQRDRGCSFLYISHDLSTVRFVADRIAVMYVGQIIEVGPTEDVFATPRHPYTKALLDSAPTLETLGQIPGAPVGELPDPHNLPPGCRFEPRCLYRQNTCMQSVPETVSEKERSHRCFFPLSSAPVGHNRES